MNTKEKKIFTTKGINLGNSFMDKFLSNLKNIELECNNDASVSEIKIFDYRTGLINYINVNPVLFQVKLQKIYRNFLEEHYFTQFFWYNKFCKLLQIYYFGNKKSFPSFSLFRTAVINCLIEISDGSINYDYTKYLNILILSMRVNGHPDEVNRKILVDMMFFFELNNLIFIKSNKVFTINDKSFSLVLFSNSLYLPFVFSPEKDEKDLVRVDISFYELSNFLDRIFTNMFFYEFSYCASRTFPKLYSIFEDEQILDIDFSIVDEQLMRNNFYYMYYYKISINEYCFLHTVLSLFGSVYNSSKFKNILVRSF